jgi:lipocalin
VRASYARRADGRLDVVNQCRTDDGRIEARGIARVVDDHTFARLKVRFAPAWMAFLPFVWGDYWIICLAEDYSWAVVGSPDREYRWILARTPRLDEKRAAAARGIARSNGFDVERLIRTAHAGSQRRRPAADSAVAGYRAACRRHGSNELRARARGWLAAVSAPAECRCRDRRSDGAGCRRWRPLNRCRCSHDRSAGKT